MQTKNLNRGVRRHNRNRAIKHAFNIYWNQYGRCNDTYKNWFTEEGFLTRYRVKNYLNDENPYLETQEERFNHEDKYRQHILDISKEIADNLRTCSCWICSGYKKHEKTPKMLREAAKDADDWADVEDSWEDAAFNPDISASSIYSHRI